jgi:hypothetical protein
VNRAIVNAAAFGFTALMLAAGGTAAAATHASEAQLRYQQERAVCLNGQSNQERTTCLKEAGAAFAEAKRDSLGRSDASALQRNQQLRCDAFKAGDREDCLRRMSGEGSTSGSAQQGGILRELARPE